MTRVNPVLRTPPKLRPDTLRVTPLGGLGDVGRNMTMFEINGQLLLIDCGVLFPEDHHPGVDLILPGLDVIADRLDDITALVLTHGHEDHIGAVPYLLKQRNDIPVIGSRLTGSATSTSASSRPAVRPRSASSPASSSRSTTRSPTRWRWR